MEVKEKVKQARLDMGMTVRAFAKAISVGKSTVYRWEKGQATPQYAHAKAIAELVDDGSDTLYYMNDR